MPGNHTTSGHVDNFMVSENQTAMREAVGLGNVTNHQQVRLSDKATQGVAEGGTDNTTWMTPLRTAQAIFRMAVNVDLRNYEDQKDGDDWAPAVQAAIDAAAAAGGGTVFFPNGDYGDLSGVEVPASVRLVAQSSTGVVLSGAGVGTYAALDANGKIRSDELPDLILAGLRQGTREELDAADPPLMPNEPAWETDTETFRVGNVRITPNQLVDLEFLVDSFSEFSRPSLGFNETNWTNSFKYMTSRTDTLPDQTCRTTTGYARLINWDKSLSAVVGSGTPEADIVLNNPIAAAAPYDAWMPKMVGILPCNDAGAAEGLFTEIRLPSSNFEVSKVVFPEDTTAITALQLRESAKKFINLAEFPALRELDLLENPAYVSGLDQLADLDYVRLGRSFLGNSIDLSGATGLGVWSIFHNPSLETITLPSVVVTEMETSLSSNNLKSIRAPGLIFNTPHHQGHFLGGNQLSAEALNQFFEDLGPTSTNAEIWIQDNPGTAFCDPTIATAKGYTIVGV